MWRARGLHRRFGGQKQRIGLARAFYRSPTLLVLDEVTSALDAETEHALFERFAEQAREARADGRVTILVSHRFSTVRMADEIVVLDADLAKSTKSELFAKKFPNRFVEMGIAEAAIAAFG